MSTLTYTCYQTNNDILMKHIAELYFNDKDVIADVTYGKGVFWKSIDTTRFHLITSDLITVPERQWDFRNLPYTDEIFDIVVFDPPYCHNPGQMIVDANYQNQATTKGFYHNDIIQLYRNGMREALRILKVGGLLLVKCKDEIESSKQRRSHIEIYNIAIDELGMVDQDLFVLHQKTNAIIQHKKQQHARKNNSYMWVFKKSV